MRVFLCLYKGEGDPRYHWPDDNSLKIVNVTRNHAGVYTVKCTNEEGANQTSIRLDVLCKEMHTLAATHTRFNSFRCVLFKSFSSV